MIAHSNISSYIHTPTNTPTQYVYTPTVYADLQILEQQRQESERQLQSARLHQKQKLAEQQQLEGKLLELKSQNGGMRAELQRASAELALRHRELQDAQTNADTSRKDTDRFDGKLKRVIGWVEVIALRVCFLGHLFYYVCISIQKSFLNSVFFYYISLPCTLSYNK